MSTTLLVILIGVLFLVKFLSGVWLTFAGRPYNVALLTVHKLISLLTAVLVGILVYRQGRQVGLSPAEMVAVVIAGLLFLLALATGGLASLKKPGKKIVFTIHRITPFLAVIATWGAIYLVVWAR